MSALWARLSAGTQEAIGIVSCAAATSVVCYACRLLADLYN